MADFKASMKEHDEVARNTISLARAAIKQYEIDERKELDDRGVIGILQKQVKMRTDALADFEKAGRTDLTDAYMAEIKVLEKYLPEQISDEEVAEIVRETAASMGIDGGRENMGRLMGAVMGKINGQADGNTVRRIVSDFLDRKSVV